MEAANALLPAYLAGHNARFAVPAAHPEDAHRPYSGTAEGLARICALHETRTLSKDLVLSFRGQRYLVQTGGAPRYALRGAKVSVITHSDGRIELLHGEESLPFNVFDPARPANPPVDEVLERRRWSEKSRPAADHPWRRYPGPPPSGAGQLASP